MRPAPMHAHYDVIVVGGGTAGVVAAVQAGRAGARTLLLETTGILGGTIVNALLTAPDFFHAEGRPIIAGIGWELCLRALRECGQPPPEPGPPRGNVRFLLNPAIYAAVCDEAVQEAGVDLLLHVLPAAVCRPDADWTLTLATKTGLEDVTARVLVDCTGDANVVSLAGFDVRRSAELQPASLVVRLGGYDAKALDYPALQLAFEAAVAAGSVRRTDPGWARGQVGPFLRQYGGNATHLPGVDGRTSAGKTAAELEGRRAMMRLLRWARTQPGLGQCRVEHCAVECGIRETATIRGKRTVTAADYESGRLFEDAVCYAHYPVDIHRADYVEARPLAPGVRPTIPLGALLPEGSRFLIVAGRCAAGDQAANSAFRVKAPCMAMGQAAGAAAALAAQRGTDPADLPIADLRALLRRHGAIVPGPPDAPTAQASP